MGAKGSMVVVVVGGAVVRVELASAAVMRQLPQDCTCARIAAREQLEKVPPLLPELIDGYMMNGLVSGEQPVADESWSASAKNPHENSIRRSELGSY